MDHTFLEPKILLHKIFFCIQSDQIFFQDLTFFVELKIYSDLKFVLDPKS